MNLKKAYETLASRVLDMLRQRLSPKLLYHCAAHTEDVIASCERIYTYEKKEVDDEAFYALKLAALFHDTGFLETYNEHETKSADIAARTMLSYGCSQDQVDRIKKLILVTHLKAEPKTELEKMICDADLDYLGRSDFLTISERLKKEWLWQGIITPDTDWETLQVNFLSSHKYYTTFGQQKRKPVKEKHLEKLKQSVSPQ